MGQENEARTLVVMPTYNERENIERTVDAVIASAPGADILVVDDASPDGTGDLADGLAHTHAGRVRVLHREGKNGLGSAYLEGFALAVAAGYGMICEMDADGSHSPSDLPALIGAVRGGADVAIGSRRIAGGRVIGWGPRRHLMSWGAMNFARIALGLRTKDVTAGFRCYSADVVRHLLSQGVESDGYAFQEETLFLVERAGFRVRELPTVFRDRERGTSKLSRQDVREFFATVLRLRKR